MQSDLQKYSYICLENKHVFVLNQAVIMNNQRHYEQ